MKKRLLYFMPENPWWTKAGNITRSHQMLRYFEKNKDLIDVHFVSSINWTQEAVYQFEQEYPSVKLFVVDFKSSKKNRIKYFLTDKLPFVLKKLWTGMVVNRVSPSFKKRFQQLVYTHGYDVVIISYAEYGDLVEGLDDVHKIVDTHDFFSLQYIQKTAIEKQKSIGKVFAEEVKLLRLFDQIWTFSVEEEYIFEQFTNKKVQLIPLSFPNNTSRREMDLIYDVVYVASNNPHNIKSMRWFMDNVLPVLHDIKVHVVGRICEEIQDHPNVIKLGMLDDLDAIYRKTKITICPMLSGTGIKIKVLESLSYGIPVVTSRRGVDGLINKLGTGCIVANDAREFAEGIRTLVWNQSFYNVTSRQASDYFSLFHTPEMENSVLKKSLLLHS